MAERFKVAVLKIVVFKKYRGFESHLARIIYKYMKKQIIFKTFITEIYFRHIYTLNAFIITFIAAYEYSYELLYLFVKPLNHILQKTQKTETISFIFTNMSESFTTHLTITLFYSILLTGGFYICQLILFLVPGLYKKNFRAIIKLSLTTLLFLFSFIFCTINYLLPQLWTFFLSFEYNTEYTIFKIELQAKIFDYIYLSINILLVILAILISFIIINIQIFYYKTLKIIQLIKFRKYIYICILTLAAIISPPDIFSQILFSIPIFICYELTICYHTIRLKYEIQHWRRQDSNLR